MGLRDGGDGVPLPPGARENPHQRTVILWQGAYPKRRDLFLGTGSEASMCYRHPSSLPSDPAEGARNEEF
jgi:hypothetical protein